jgi:hypothetical protein
MKETKLDIGQITQFGSAKIAGLSCNKKSATTLRIDVEVPAEDIRSVIDALGLELTDDLKAALNPIADLVTNK